MKQLNITNKPRCDNPAPILSVASDGFFDNKHPLPSQASDCTNVSTVKVVKRRCRIPQQWTVSGDTASADIGAGNIAVVDLVDLPLVQGRKWFPLHREHNTYASHGKGILMHRLVSGAGKGQRVDHEDNNGLNNRRDNLRRCNQIQNRANSRKFKVGTSRYKGVTGSATDGKWRGYCGPRKGRVYLGTFESEELAARAYDVAAQKLWGSFAKLNFPVTTETLKQAAA